MQRDCTPALTHPGESPSHSQKDNGNWKELRTSCGNYGRSLHAKDGKWMDGNSLDTVRERLPKLRKLGKAAKNDLIGALRYIAERTDDMDESDAALVEVAPPDFNRSKDRIWKRIGEGLR